MEVGKGRKIVAGPERVLPETMDPTNTTSDIVLYLQPSINRKVIYSTSMHYLGITAIKS